MLAYSVGKAIFMDVKVLSGTIYAAQCLSSRATVWKSSSSSSECTGVVSGFYSPSELSEGNDR